MSKPGIDVVCHVLHGSALLVLALLLGCHPSPQRERSSQPQPVRVSFLQDSTPMKDTLGLLGQVQVPAYSQSLFERAVNLYNETPPSSLLEKFPQPQDGYYSFDSMDALLKRLPGKLCDTAHPYQLNCFDAIFTLLNDRFIPAVGITEKFSRWPVPSFTTNGIFMIAAATTALEAYTACYPPGYRMMSEDFFPVGLAHIRIAHTAGLFRFHELPTSVTEQDLGQAVLGILRTHWKAQQLIFPREMGIIMCHDVNFPGRLFVTVHMGLLFRNQKGFVFLEKAGGQGPFVRLEFGDKRDLRKWLVRTFTGAEARKLGYTHHFITYNDATVETLEETPTKPQSTGYATKGDL